MEKVDYSKYLDCSDSNFKLPIRADNYETTYDDPFNFTKIDLEGILSINLDSLIYIVNKDIKDSGLNNYTFYNFEDFFNELLDINMLYQYTVDSDDLKALYSCVMDNIKKVKE